MRHAIDALMASNKETPYLNTKCICVIYSKITESNSTKIPDIVFRDVRKVYRANSLNHVKKKKKCQVLKSIPLLAVARLVRILLHEARCTDADYLSVDRAKLRYTQTDIRLYAVHTPTVQTKTAHGSGYPAISPVALHNNIGDGIFLYTEQTTALVHRTRYIVFTHKRALLSFIHSGGGGVSARQAHTSTPRVLRVSAAAI